MTPDESTTRVISVGFRTIELVQDQIDSADPKKGLLKIHNNNSISSSFSIRRTFSSYEFSGLTFYFKVNGVPVYAKGTNSIPIHVLPERATSEMTRWLFESSKEAHFNMIRVWGGGIYESEEFYQVDKVIFMQNRLKVTTTVAG